MLPIKENEQTSQGLENQVTKPSLNDCRSNKTSVDEGMSDDVSIIRKPGRDEAFVLIDSPIVLGCLIDRKQDDFGGFQGEFYHPVVSAVQERLISQIRSIAFHPCQSQTGENFIFPQKLSLIKTANNIWNNSLAEALCTPQGEWIRVWSDADLKRYQFEKVEIETDQLMTYPNFEEDLEKALSSNIINSLDHPVVQSLKAAKSNSGGGWEAIPNV